MSVYEEAARRLLCFADLLDRGEPVMRASHAAGLLDGDEAEIAAILTLFFVKDMRFAELTVDGSTAIADVEREAAGLLLAGWRP